MDLRLSHQRACSVCSLAGQNALLMVNVIGNIRVQLYPNVAPFRRRGEQDYEILRNTDSFVLRSGDRWRSSANSGRSCPPEVLEDMAGDRPESVLGGATVQKESHRPRRATPNCAGSAGAKEHIEKRIPVSRVVIYPEPRGAGVAAARARWRTDPGGQLQIQLDAGTRYDT
jgi:hypothetical protein